MPTQGIRSSSSPIIIMNSWWRVTRRRLLPEAFGSTCRTTEIFPKGSRYLNRTEHALCVPMLAGAPNCTWDAQRAQRMRMDVIVIRRLGYRGAGLSPCRVAASQSDSTYLRRRQMINDLQDFLQLSYTELEELNLEAKEQRLRRVPVEQVREARLKYLTDEKRIKAVTLLFSDLEGRLHMLDYDKKFLLKSWDNLTFDGSSIRGFTAQRESDLRLYLDWPAFYWAPGDIFGPGKVLVFGEVIDKDGTPYGADIRGILKSYANTVHDQHGYTLNAANEIEGFLFKGADAERAYHETGKFEYVNTGGYYHSLPGDPLRTFIDRSAEVQRAMGFQN